MAYTKITFENPKTNEIRVAPVGFSWTVMLFGCLPAVFRSNWKWAGIMFFALVVSLGFAGLVFMFIYNKLYITDLIGKGFKAKSILDNNMEKASAKIGLTIPLLEESD